MAWAQYGATTALVVFGGSVKNIVKPWMMGDRLEISPVVVFVSLWPVVLVRFSPEYTGEKRHEAPARVKGV